MPLLINSPKYLRKMLLQIATVTPFVVTLLFFLTIYSVQPTFATENSVLEKQKIEAKNKLEQTTAQKKTLSEQIESFDSQIASIQSEIDVTQGKLSELSQNISELNKNIALSEGDIKTKRKLLGEYLKTIYINGQTSQLELILTSNNFSDFVDKSEYLQKINNSIQDAVKEIEIAKTNLEKRKLSLQESEAKTLILRGEQTSRRSAVQSQLSAKENLLTATKGDENVYKALISNIQNEINKNNEVVWNDSLISQGHVNKGDIIGYIGNSGYSTGPHLHFEIRSNKSTTVNPSNYIGNGYFIDPAPSVPINVRYGRTSDYLWCDNEKDWCFHSGIDKADGGVGTPVRATADGEIVARVSGYGNTFPNKVIYGNYVMIQHTNGMFSLYGHLRN